MKALMIRHTLRLCCIAWTELLCFRSTRGCYERILNKTVEACLTIGQLKQFLTLQQLLYQNIQNSSNELKIRKFLHLPSSRGAICWFALVKLLSTM